MKFRFQIPLLVLVLVLACATVDVTQPLSNAPDLVSFLRAPRACFTPCGMRVLEGDCESLQRYEGRVLKGLAAAVPEWTEEKVCRDLRGLEIQIHRHDPVADKGCSPRGWRLPHECDAGRCEPGICVAGLTRWVDGTITLSQTDWDQSALAHEIAHVADVMRPGHCPWARAELKAALKDLAGYDDPSVAEPMCSP